MKISGRNVLILGLIAALSVGGFLFVSRQYYGIGFPLDDAWIHQTYARNLAGGEGWSFFPGQPSAGLTAPLWALALTPGHLLGLGPYAWTFILGWLVLWGLSILAVIGWHSLSNRKGLWEIGAGALLVVEWHMVWAAASGMETLLFSALVLGVLVWLLFLANTKNEVPDWHWLGVGLLIGLSVWVRPEGLTLLGPVGLVIVFTGVRWSKKMRRGVNTFLGFALLFVLYLWFNNWLAEAWWPNTFYAKQAEYAVLRQLPLWKRLFSEFSLPLVGMGIVLLPGFLYLIYTSCRQRAWGVLAGCLWIVGFLTLYALRLPVTYQHGRYVMPVMPVFFLWGYAGVSRLINLDFSQRLRWMVNLVWVILIPLIAVGFWILGAKNYAKDVAFINSEMVVTADWIRENTQEEDLIAAHDIGALGYFAKRQILDLAGLVSPDVIPFIRDESRLVLYLDEHHPAYLVTFQDKYPVLEERAEMIYETDGEYSQAPGGENMAVFIWSAEP